MVKTIFESVSSRHSSKGIGLVCVFSIRHLIPVDDRQTLFRTAICSSIQTKGKHRTFILFVYFFIGTFQRRRRKRQGNEQRKRSLSPPLVKLKYKGENKGNLPNLFKDNSSIELTNDAPLEPSKHTEWNWKMRMHSRFCCNAYTILAELKWHYGGTNSRIVCTQHTVHFDIAIESEQQNDRKRAISLENLWLFQLQYNAHWHKFMLRQPTKSANLWFVPEIFLSLRPFLFYFD